MRILFSILLAFVALQATAQTLVTRLRIVSVSGQTHEVAGVYNGKTATLSVGDSVLMRVRNNCVTGVITDVMMLDPTTRTFTAKVKAPITLSNGNGIIYSGQLSEVPANVPNDMVGCLVGKLLEASGSGGGGGGGGGSDVYTDSLVLTNGTFIIHRNNGTFYKVSDLYKEIDQSGSYSIDRMYYVVDCSNGAVTLTLPPASSWESVPIYLLKVDDSTNPLIINGTFSTGSFRQVIGPTFGILAPFKNFWIIN